jgi:dTDP-4-amino-4,6-dideoxygalactose transaminase
MLPFARPKCAQILPRSKIVSATPRNPVRSAAMKVASQLALRGGEPAANRPWPAWPVWDDAERRGLLDVLESGRWWYGERVRKFEEAYAVFHHVRHGVSCTNGTTAIEAGLRAIGVVPGDEVIVPPYSFIATASAVITVGAIPVFADVEPASLCLDPQDVARKISPRTRALIPVHVAGRFANMDGLSAVARQHGLQILEDAAHAWGSMLEGRGPGTIGRCATFSFQVSKNITAGEGGIILSNDDELSELCRSFTHCGRRSGSARYDHDHLGSNLRMTEFQAAILLAQLGRLDEQIARRERSAAILDRRLAELPGVRLLRPEPRMTRRSYHMYIFRLDAQRVGVSRDRFVEALAAEGVPAIAGWYHPLYKNGVFHNAASQVPEHGIISPLAGKGLDYSGVRCAVTEQVCRDAVWIPQHVLLAPEPDVHAVADAIGKLLSRAKELS